MTILGIDKNSASRTQVTLFLLLFSCEMGTKQGGVSKTFCKALKLCHRFIFKLLINAIFIPLILCIPSFRLRTTEQCLTATQTRQLKAVFCGMNSENNGQCLMLDHDYGDDYYSLIAEYMQI